MKKFLGTLAVASGSVLFGEGLEYGTVLLAIGSVLLLAGIYLICRGDSELASKTSQQQGGIQGKNAHNNADADKPPSKLLMPLHIASLAAYDNALLLKHIMGRLFHVVKKENS